MLPGESQMFSFVPQLSLTQVIPTSHTLDQTRNYSRLFIFQGSASLQLAEKTVSSISCFRNDKSQCQTLKTALQSGWDLRYPWPTNCMWPAPGSKLHRISSLLCSRRIRAFMWLPVEARVWECVCLWKSIPFVCQGWECGVLSILQFWFYKKVEFSTFLPFNRRGSNSTFFLLFFSSKWSETSRNAKKIFPFVRGSEGCVGVIGTVISDVTLVKDPSCVLNVPRNSETVISWR